MRGDQARNPRKMAKPKQEGAQEVGSPRILGEPRLAWLQGWFNAAAHKTAGNVEVALTCGDGNTRGRTTLSQ